MSTCRSSLRQKRVLEIPKRATTSRRQSRRIECHCTTTCLFSQRQKGSSPDRESSADALIMPQFYKRLKKPTHTFPENHHTRTKSVSSFSSSIRPRRHPAQTAQTETLRTHTHERRTKSTLRKAFLVYCRESLREKVHTCI